MPKQSAGLLMVRLTSAIPEVLLVHPGGPFFRNKDLGHWTVPKGEPNPGEDLLRTAQREFREETGFASHPPLLPLDTIRQAGGKLVTAWAFLGDCDPAELRSNTCEIEWPPRSNHLLTIPEVDRAAWFTLAEAHRHIKDSQRPFLDRVAALFDTRSPTPSPILNPAG